MDTDIEPGLTQPTRANSRRALRLLTFVVFAQCLLAPCALADNWQQPRMPWGDPDLQGIWTSATLTNLTRPDEVDTLLITASGETWLATHGGRIWRARDDGSWEPMFDES